MTETRRNAIMLAGQALLLVALVIPGSASGDDNRLPDLGDCQQLQVEEGNRVALVAYAGGAQIYQWNGAKWEFVAPDAVLYSGNEEDDEVVAVHYAGPTWESKSGSKVVGSVVNKCYPDLTAIPWLLLKKTSSEGPGIFAKVTFIQRLYTTGGLPPAEPGAYVGDEAHVPYTAWYVFYRKQ